MCTCWNSGRCSCCSWATRGSNSSSIFSSADNPQVCSSTHGNVTPTAILPSTGSNCEVCGSCCHKLRHSQPGEVQMRILGDASSTREYFAVEEPPTSQYYFPHFLNVLVILRKTLKRLFTNRIALLETHFANMNQFQLFLNIFNISCFGFLIILNALTLVLT